jgi:hypothetical protein
LSDDDDIEVVRCPSCGAFEEDFDGLGFLYCEVCHYCVHASATNGRCDYCGEEVKNG